MRYVAVCLLLASAFSAAQEPRTFTGVITDDQCAGAGHARMRMGPTDAECTRACVMLHDAAYVLEDLDHAVKVTHAALQIRAHEEPALIG